MRYICFELHEGRINAYCPSFIKQSVFILDSFFLSFFLSSCLWRFFSFSMSFLWLKCMWLAKPQQWICYTIHGGSCLEDCGDRVNYGQFFHTFIWSAIVYFSVWANKTLCRVSICVTVGFLGLNSINQYPSQHWISLSLKITKKHFYVLAESIMFRGKKPLEVKGMHFSLCLHVCNNACNSSALCREVSKPDTWTGKWAIFADTARSLSCILPKHSRTNDAACSLLSAGSCLVMLAVCK